MYTIYYTSGHQSRSNISPYFSTDRSLCLSLMLFEVDIYYYAPLSIQGRGVCHQPPLMTSEVDQNTHDLLLHNRRRTMCRLAVFVVHGTEWEPVNSVSQHTLTG